MENKIEAVVRENVDTALEQADEFLKQASAATGEEAKELQAKAKECLARASRNMKSFYEKTSEEGREIAGEVNDCVRSNPWRAKLLEIHIRDGIVGDDFFLNRITHDSI